MPKYSIIIPSFNAANTIADTLESIVHQTYQNFEIIVIDGASTDATMKVLQKYKDSIGFQVSEKDQGIYDAMNKGVRQANGEYVIFLGADDVFYSNRVLEDVSHFLRRDYVYYGQAYFLNKQIVYDGRFSAFKLALRNICHQAIFYPSKVLKEHEFSLVYPLLADYHLNLLLIREKVRFEYLGVIISKFNDAGASAKSIDASFESDKPKLIWEALGFLPYLYARFRHLLLPTQKIVLGWLRRNLQQQ